MDTKTLTKSIEIWSLIFCICCGFASCTRNSEEKEEEQKKDFSAIEERRKAIELAYEYEQFVNKVLQELNVLSDDLTDLHVNKEVSAHTRKTKMASIEKNLKSIEKRLKEAEKNQTLRDSDRQRIIELHKAIKRKDEVIKKLKNENQNLRDTNTSLQTQLQKTDQNLQIKSQTLEDKKQEIVRQRVSNASDVERLGDNLRRIVTNMEGIKGTGTYAPLKAGQIKLVEASIYCYKQAYRINPSSSLDIKIQRTERGLEVYRNSKDLSGLDF